jgi:hypothetical protein
MSERCATIQDQLPDLAAGRLGEAERAGVEVHLRGCAACSEAFETLCLLAAAPVEAPAGLEGRIQAAVRSGSAAAPLADARPSTGRARPGQRRRWMAPVWGLAAAAAVALLMGRTLLPSADSEPDLLAMADGEIPVLLADDAMVAGALVLDGLSDDDLALLLEELER